MGRSLFVAGTLPMIIAGFGHAVLALIDTFRPRYFKPTKNEVTLGMKDSGIALRRMAPGSRVESPTVWSTWLGMHVSHGIGVGLFGLLMLLIALHDFDLVTQIPGVRALSIVVPATYFGLCLVYWFYGPAIITGLSLACFSAAALAG